MQCAVYGVQCAVCSMYCAVCCVQCSVCSVQCADKGCVVGWWDSSCVLPQGVMVPDYGRRREGCLVIVYRLIEIETRQGDDSPSPC